MQQLRGALAVVLFTVGCTGDVAPETNFPTGPGPAGTEPVAPPAETEPTTVPVEIPAETPAELDPTIVADLIPIAPSDFYTPTDAPVFGRSYAQRWPLDAGETAAIPAAAKAAIGGVQLAAAVSDVPTTGPFSFEVTSLRYTEWDPDIAGLAVGVVNLSIDGQDKGDVEGGEIQVPRTQASVQVTLGVWGSYRLYHDLGNGIGSVQHFSSLLESYTFSVSALGDEEGCATGSNGIGSICWRARGPQSPPICFAWQAQYVDSGPWSDFPSEDYAVSLWPQEIPASYARVDLRIERTGVGETYAASEVLDEMGCLSADRLPIIEQWDANVSAAVFRLSTQFCYDTNGGGCANGAGVNIDIRSGKTATGPEAYCWAMTNDPGKVPGGCEHVALADLDVKHFLFRPAPAEVAQVGAVMGHILRREYETGGDLGVNTAIAERHFRGTRGLIVRTDTACAGTELASCMSGNTIYLAPSAGADVSAGSRYKYLIAHEFAHFLQDNGQGLPGGFYYNAPTLTANPLCGCDHVDPDLRSHCLQSLEEPTAAQMEGFAQFFAAKVWNRDAEANDFGCTFVYYKSIVAPDRLPGVRGFYGSFEDLVVNPSPVAVDCGAPVRWRNTYCTVGVTSPDVYVYGTEYDWMGFYYAINNDPDPARRWSVIDIFDAYLAACKLVDPSGAFCKRYQIAPGQYVEHSVSWDGTSVNNLRYDNLREGAKRVYGSSTSAFQAFVEAADAYGVSRK